MGIRWRFTRFTGPQKPGRLLARLRRLIPGYIPTPSLTRSAAFMTGKSGALGRDLQMTVFVGGRPSDIHRRRTGRPRFDGPGHGLSHCMKAVDFVVEFPERFMYIEFTDPDHPRTQYDNRQKFIQDLTGRVLIEELEAKVQGFILIRVGDRARRQARRLCCTCRDEDADRRYPHF